MPFTPLLHCTSTPSGSGTIPPSAPPNCWPNGALHGVAMPLTRAARHTSRSIRFPERPTGHNFHAIAAHTPRTAKPPAGKTNERNQQEKPPQPWSTHKTNPPEAVRPKHASAPMKRTPQELFQTFRHDMPAYSNHQVRAQRLQVFLTGCIQ